MKVTVTPILKNRVLMSDMTIGQLGRITSPLYQGHIVYRTHSFAVSLTKPSTDWTNPAGNPLEVEILPAGTVITLEVE